MATVVNMAKNTKSIFQILSRVCVEGGGRREGSEGWTVHLQHSSPEKSAKASFFSSFDSLLSGILSTGLEYSWVPNCPLNGMDMVLSCKCSLFV